jgi:hypothetical protein
MLYLKNFMDLYQLLLGLLRINVIFKKFYGFKSIIVGFFRNLWVFKGVLSIYNKISGF